MLLGGIETLSTELCHILNTLANRTSYLQSTSLTKFCSCRVEINIKNQQLTLRVKEVFFVLMLSVMDRFKGDQEPKCSTFLFCASISAGHLLQKLGRSQRFLPR